MIHARRIGHGEHGRRYWLLRESGTGYDDLGYAKRLGFRRWVWQNERSEELSERVTSMKRVVYLAHRTVPKGHSLELSR